MQVFDEIAKARREISSCKTVVVNHLPNCIVYGYVGREIPTETILVYRKGRGYTQLQGCFSMLKDILFFSNKRGIYISKVDLPEYIYLDEVYSKGQGEFPYNFERRYEAIENFKLFEGKQVVMNPEKSYPISEFLEYTFGLEFETSQGFIPQRLCFRDGLIPLRDGSISGVEYSTVVLEGNSGIALLEQQLDTLRRYTNFNKECSLHIHFGGYPLNAEKLFNLYKLCKVLEPELECLLPKDTFYTSKYKKNGKDYCRKLRNYSNFNQMYEHLVGRRFFNDFTQPHPNDISRQTKWRIPTRYYFVNFINALCYNVNKTIEFRFLRPTYNYNKIVLWIYILNAILRFAEEHIVTVANGINLNTILRKIYPIGLSERLILGVKRLAILTQNQTANEDYIGADLHLEDELFSGNLGY